MNHKALFTALAISFVSLMIVYPVLAFNHTTATVDGVVSLSEYAGNTYISGSQTWYITWDNTDLYIGISGANLYEAMVLYIDKDPQTPVNGGEDSNGTNVGFAYDNTNFAALQFRADVVIYAKRIDTNNYYREYRLANGSNGWGTQTSNFGSYADGAGDVREIQIPWSTIGGRPTSFNWFGYLTSSAGFVYGTAPLENLGGSIGTSARYARYFTVSDTGAATSQNPFGRNCFVFNETSDIPNFGAINVWDFTMNTSGRTITRASGIWTIAGDLRIDNGTISFGSTSDPANVSGDIFIGSGGTLTLSSAIGGDLNVSGDFTNDAAFNASNRAVTFTGSGAQSVGGSSNPTTFDYLSIGSTSNLGLTGNISVNNNLTIPSGAALSLNSYILTLQNGADLTNSGTLNANTGTLAFQGASGGSSIFTNNGTFNRNSSTATFSGYALSHARTQGSQPITFNDVTLSSSSGNFGIDFYDHDTDSRAHIAGTLTLNISTFIASEESGSNTTCTSPDPDQCDGTPIYDSGSTLRYNTGGAFNAAAEWWPDDGSSACNSDKGLPYNVTVANNTALNTATAFSNNNREPYYNANPNRYLCGTLTVENGSTFQSTGGTMTIAGNWSNNGSSSQSAGTIIFQGSTPQTIGGSASTSFNNLTINNSSDTSLELDQTVAGTLRIQNGVLDLSNHTLALGTAANIVADNPGTGAMILADETGGQICKNYMDGSSNPDTLFLPIGDNTNNPIGTDYSPASLDFNFSSASSPQFCIYVRDAAHSNNNGATDYLTRYWTVNRTTGSATFTCSVSFTYLAGDIVGSEGSIYGQKHDGSSWINLGLVSGGSLGGSVTSFSDVSGGPDGVTAVTIADIHTQSGPHYVHLAWQTAIEIDLLGFNILRYGTDGQPQRLNPALIPASLQMFGDNYSFTDFSATPGTTYTYWIEALNLDGSTELHPAFEATPGYGLFLPVQAQ